MEGKRWEVLKKIKNFKNPKLKEIEEILLQNRGIKTQKEKVEFINPTKPQDLSLKELGIDPDQVNKAILRVKKALKNNEEIIIYGDYDADGICATAITWEALYSLTKNCIPYIPERFSEGYGLNSDSVRKLKNKYEKLKLIITVDNGIVANDAINIANELGIDVIITDHHQAENKKPKALAIIHTTKIGGAQVAWIFAREVVAKIHSSKFVLQNSLELAGIGTIADQLPLIGPNRSFAKYGLEALNKTVRLGLLALFETSGIEKGKLGTYEVNFLIAPRLNAMGRIEHAIDSLRLLCTNNKSKATELAQHINRTNLQRQKIVEEVVIKAKNQVLSQKSQGLIIIADSSYHEGVIGLAASKLVEEFYRPAIVISKKENPAKASARSVPGFNIIETIRIYDEYLTGGGGHPMAAGFSIEHKNIDIFSRKIIEFSSKLLTTDLLSRSLKIDLELDFSPLNQELLNLISIFNPSGIGNPTPTFVTKEVEVLDARLVGSGSNHLKLKLSLNSIVFDAIAFNQGQKITHIHPKTKINIAYNMEENTWNGNKSIQLKIKDIKLK